MNKVSPLFFKAYTDMPFSSLGDTPCKEAPIRECIVVGYDNNKYCDIIVNGSRETLKSGYLYTKHGRIGEVPNVSNNKLHVLFNAGFTADM